jgi:hypothetical protein
MPIVGAIAGYYIGKRKEKKNRIDDPTAGAGKLVQDPSLELSISPLPSQSSPTAAELPVNQDQGPVNPSLQVPQELSASKEYAELAQSPVQYPQELPTSTSEEKAAMSSTQAPQELPASPVRKELVELPGREPQEFPA